MKIKHVIMTLGLAAVLGLGVGAGLKASQAKEAKATNEYGTTWYINGHYGTNDWSSFDGFTYNSGKSRYEKTINFAADDTFKLYNDNKWDASYIVHRGMSDDLIDYSRGWHDLTNWADDGYGKGNFVMKTAGVYTISYDSTIESGYDNPGLAFQIEDVVQVWIDTYMHMSDYDKDGELGSTKGTGLCSGYYDLAKPALLALGSDAVTHFSGDTASKYTAALARYNEWARIKKDANPFNSGDASNVIKVSETNNNTTIAIVAVSAISLIAIGSFFFIRKKKESK